MALDENMVRRIKGEYHKLYHAVDQALCRWPSTIYVVCGKEEAAIVAGYYQMLRDQRGGSSELTLSKIKCRMRRRPVRFDLKVQSKIIAVQPDQSMKRYY